MEEEPPLPDVFFDVVPERFSKAFDVCETLGCIQAVFTILVVVFHRHRYVKKTEHQLILLILNYVYT